MGKVEGIIKAEIVRLAKREIRKISVPLGQDVWSMKSAVSKLRKTVLALERFVAHQQKEMSKTKPLLEASPEEVKESRFYPHLIRSLRGHLGITQKDLAVLTGVTVGAIHQWESGLFKPSLKKKAVMVALRKLGRREVMKLIEEKRAEMTKRASPSLRRRIKRAKRK